MTRYYPDLGSAPDWLKQISLAVRPIRNTKQIWVMKRHQYGISALVLQTSFRGENSRGVAKCRVFSQAIVVTLLIVFAARRKVDINSNVNRVLEFPISDIATCKPSVKQYLISQ